MSPYVRRGGSSVDGAGLTTTWSVAEGRRGRRWRWAVVDARGVLVAGHTVELAPDGAFARLESASAAGLLSLHREGDGSVHGNRVAPGGVDHIEIPAPAPTQVLVGDGAIGAAILIAGLGSPAAAGSEVVEVLEVGDDLRAHVGECRITLVGDRGLEVRTDRGPRRVHLDASGLPADEGAGTTSWDLERH